MKAILFKKYGSPDDLQYGNTDKPIPKVNEVLIKIHAASVNAADWHILRADPFPVRFESGLFKPKYNSPGADIAGVVEAVGADVTEFNKGDEVYVDLSGNNFGGYAEYVAVPTKNIAHKPISLSFEEAAAIPMAAVTALTALEKGDIKNAGTVAINGASGGVGTFAIQLAKYFGVEVTAICSTKNIELVKSIGADFAIDYKNEDFTEGTKKYDLIYAVNGFHPLSHYKRVLSPTGSYVASGGTMKQLIQANMFGSFHSKKKGQQFSGILSSASKEKLNFISQVVQEEKLMPVIDKTFTLEQVPEAIKYMEEVHPSGKIVIKIV